MTYRTMDNRSLRDAVFAGAGIGFIPLWERHGRADLVDVIAQQAEWSAALWIVTHVDLHRHPKVQAFLAHLKDAAKAWVC